MTMAEIQHRRLPMGAEINRECVHFRVWAPKRRQVAVVIGGALHALGAEAGGYFAAAVPGIKAGARYAFRLDEDDRLYPDPASRFQPNGPHGESEVIDPTTFRWSDTEWRGISPERVVAYEMHIGTFTTAGTWRTAEDELPA